MKRAWTRPPLVAGDVWAWSSPGSSQLERVRIAAVGSLRARGTIVGEGDAAVVDDLLGRFWCPWDQLADCIEARIETGVTLRAAQAGLKPAGGARAVVAAVQPPTVGAERVAYTLDAAAEECGVSPQFLREFVNRNDLVAHYANSRMLILTEDLRAWVRSLPQERHDWA